MKLRSCLRSFWSLVVRGRLIVSLVAVLAALLGAVWWCGWEGLRMVWWWSWEWLGGVSECRETRSTTIRNIGLLVGGGIAIWVAYWRSVISQRGLLNERYQKGAEMLGSPVLSVRLGGIYALQRLAEDDPKQYHVQIVRLFSAFARDPTKKGGDEIALGDSGGQLDIKQSCEDVQEAVRAIGNRSATDIKFEEKEAHLINLTRANLTRANLTAANLTGVFLAAANLTGVSLAIANLTGAHLKDAHLRGAILDHTNLIGANLTGADLYRAKGLTQDQLNLACADPDNPPKLDGACDAETGAPLKWRGPPCRKLRSR